MGNPIQWPRAKYWDKAWNPILGCRACSPGCENCYAMTTTLNRFKQSFEPHTTGKQVPPGRGIVFCGNMTDLFGPWNMTSLSAEYIGKCVNRGALAYLWLTKRVDRMCKVLNDERVMLIPAGYDEDSGEYFHLTDPECNLSNHYFGFTAENQLTYDNRVATWRRCQPPGINGWLSAEPLLGLIDLGLAYIAPEDIPFKWVVVGCESGLNRRPCDIAWIEDIVAQCLARDIPVFVKQICLEDGTFTNDINQFPEHLRIRQVPWVVKEVASNERSDN